MENFLEDGDSKKTENLNPGQGQHQLQIELKCTGLKNMPTPSPRSFSLPRIELQEQNEGLKANLPSCDRPGSLHNSDHQAACTVEGGEHNLAAMAKELDYLRQTNKKLQEALMTRERELETLKLDAELQEQAAEARIAEKTAGLVEEVYRAQRERDEAVMARLRLANEERDEALLRVQQFKLYLKELEDISSEEGDTSLQELLCRLWEANGSTAIQQNGNLILELIRKSRERRDEITAEEMGAVIRERDSARVQCKHLEEELHLLRESKQTSEDIVTTEKTLEPPCKAELTFLQNDQDKVIENYKQLEEELQTLRVYYSLHQSLTQEENLKEQYSKAITIYENALKNREELLSIIQQQNHQLCFQLQQAQGQNTEIQESLQRATSSQREAEEKVHKLERLVDVLRKKVGFGNVRTVI